MFKTLQAVNLYHIRMYITYNLCILKHKIYTLHPKYIHNFIKYYTAIAYPNIFLGLHFHNLNE